MNLTLIKDENSTTSNKKSDVKLTGSTVDQIKQLNDLYEAGVLTEQEFSQAKKKLLN